MGLLQKTLGMLLFQLILGSLQGFVPSVPSLLALLQE